MKHPQNSPLGRLGVETLEDTEHACVATVPVGRLDNPLTGLPTTATLAMAVDHAGGLLNHRRREGDVWTVTSELSLELTPDAAAVIAAEPDLAVRACARPLGVTTASSAVAACDLALGDHQVGIATLRSFYIPAPADMQTDWAIGASDGDGFGGLADRLAFQVGDSGAEPVIFQRPDPALNNTMRIVHGGVTAVGLELVASAAVNAGRSNAPLITGALRVQYMRPFQAGAQSRYVGAVVRTGRSSAIGEAQAIGDDGAVALMARLSAYHGP